MIANPVAWRRSVVFLLLGLISMAARPDCPVADSTPRPPWADVSHVPAEGEFSASASAPIAKGAEDASAAAARTQAVRQIAEQIQVRITSEVQLTEQATELDGEMKATSSYSAAVRQDTDLVLDGARTTGRWIDPEACVVWVRVQLPAAQALAAQKRAVGAIASEALRTLMVRAEDPAIPLATRDRSIRAAAALIDSSNIEIPAELGDAKVVRQNIRLASDRIAELMAVRATRAGKLRSARELVSRHPGDRAASSEAQRLLRSVFEGASFADDPEDPVYDAAFELAGILRADRDACAAGTILSRISKESPLEAIRERATREGRTLTCTDQGASQSVLRDAIGGRPVAVYCPVVIRGEGQKTWSRSCDELSRLAREAGGSPNIASSAAMRAALGPGGACSTACLTKLKASGEGVMLLSAQGSIEQRANPGNPQATDYQFKGAISLLVAAKGEALVSENFSGTTGWNPVSGDTALDVVALQSSKRLQKRLAELSR